MTRLDLDPRYEGVLGTEAIRVSQILYKTRSNSSTETRKNITCFRLALTLPNHCLNYSHPRLDVPVQSNSSSSPLDEVVCVHPLVAKLIRTAQTESNPSDWLVK